jgi:hypothetical protein
MTATKCGLFITTAIVASLANGAAAQVPLVPKRLFPVEIRGAGSSVVDEIVVRAFNCIGRPGPGLNKLNNMITIPPGHYTPTMPTAANPSLDCNTQEIQPDFAGAYVAAGSGFGRQMWAEFNDKFAAVGATNPFGPWPNLQVAFTDRPVASDDLSTYNARARPAAGRAIALPFFVVPIALAYNPVYGFKRSPTGTLPLTLNVKGTIPRDRAGNAIGGLRLSREAYCKILNGEITNFNDPILTRDNLRTPLNDPRNDMGARWSEEGVPIRLVANSGAAGTTETLTRHLATICTGLAATNRFVRSASALPYDPAVGPDMTIYGSVYRPSGLPTSYAGSAPTISGAFYDAVSDRIDLRKGGELLGRFMLAADDSGVAKAVQSSSAAVLKPSTRDPDVTLNGKFGFVAADWVKPTPTRDVFSAVLQEAPRMSGNPPRPIASTVYRSPIASHADLAFAPILPPQTTSSGGLWNVNDARKTSTTGVPLDRSSPLDWADVLYLDPKKSLANPQRGYPIVGTTSLLTYTCFSTPAKRLGIGEFIGVINGVVKKKSDGTGLSPLTFLGTVPSSFGIFPQSNITTVAASLAWQRAITETFLIRSRQRSGLPGDPQLLLGDRNLWIQDYIPTRNSDFDASPANLKVQPNPDCFAVPGA